MISTILIWIYIFILTTLTGHFLFSILGRLTKASPQPEPSIADLSILGTVSIGIFLSYFSLFSKIGLLANLILATASFIYFLSAKKSIISYFKNQIQKFSYSPSVIKILIFVYFVLILFAAQLYPTVSDTGLYHAQNIQWITDFKIIPGLGNLHGRFAFNNHSFLLEALFSLSFLKAGYFHLVNSYLLIILSVTLLHNVWETSVVKPIRSFLYTGLLILLQVFYLKSASSPTPDILALAGIWFIFIIYLERISSAPGNKVYWIHLFLISFFLVTVKLSAFPVALVAVLFLLESDYSFFKRILLVSIPGVVVFVPFFIRNYFLSGYMVYPYSSVDLFHPDWKIPAEFVNEMKSIISTHAQAGDWQHRIFSGWLPIWFSHLSGGFKFLSCFILVSPALTAIIIFMSKQLRIIYTRELKILTICFIAIVLWFFSAPNFRFIYPFLFYYLLITAIILIHFFSQELSRSGFFRRLKEKFVSFYLSWMFYALLIIFPTWFILKFNYREVKQCMLLPTGYRNVPVKTMQINNLRLNIPADSTYCWNSPLPCSLFQKDIGITNIEMRGQGLKDGFRAKNN